MHSDDELGHDQGTALLRISKHPDTAQNLVGQARLLKYLLRLVSREHVALEWLTFENG
jgi:hypothetical protein